MQTRDTKCPLIVALDGMALEDCLAIVGALGERARFYKITDLWDDVGPSCVKAFRDRHALVWVDSKLKGRPDIVRERVIALRDAGANFVSVMADGEVDMMVAAMEFDAEIGIIAVTVPTWLTEEQVHLTYGHPPRAAALHLARLAKLAGVSRIVCSPQEVGPLSKRVELKGMQYFVTGIRRTGEREDQHQRYGTPAAAVKAGAGHLVIGRPITYATDPLVTFQSFEAEIVAAMEERR